MRKSNEKRVEKKMADTATPSHRDYESTDSGHMRFN